MLFLLFNNIFLLLFILKLIAKQKNKIIKYEKSFIILEKLKNTRKIKYLKLR